jgi:hypothetical protein
MSVNRLSSRQDITMIKLFFLLPIIMCAIWWWYLNNHGYSVKEGIKGFTYILILNTAIILFFTTMIYITR